MCPLRRLRLKICNSVWSRSLWPLSLRRLRRKICDSVCAKGSRLWASRNYSSAQTVIFLSFGEYFLCFGWFSGGGQDFPLFW